MSRLLSNFAKDRSAASSIEYGMLAFGVAVAIVVAVLSLGDGVTAQYQSVDNALQ
ncbi:MAG: Flp/Fap pilin component [Alphaproteobacteria bacterium]|jgi:pilus assembly protein Flp/PilA|nr:Flp/Fap pilin component [Alphaproteobacteria bacterium]MEA2987674.1 Flp/Fap pilin component [Alphaproteobacteria bacterium]